MIERTDGPLTGLVVVERAGRLSVSACKLASVASRFFSALTAAGDDTSVRIELEMTATSSSSFSMLSLSSLFANSCTSVGKVGISGVPLRPCNTAGLSG